MSATKCSMRLVAMIGDGVAGGDAPLHQRGGDVERELAGLRPGQGAPRLALGQPVLVGVGRVVAAGGDGVGEGVDEGASLDVGLDAGAFAQDIGHGRIVTGITPQGKRKDQTPSIRPMISFWISVVPP